MSSCEFESYEEFANDPEEQEYHATKRLAKSKTELELEKRYEQLRHETEKKYVQNSKLYKDIKELAESWEARGEHLKEYSKQCPADVSEFLFEDGCEMVWYAQQLKKILKETDES